MSGLVVAPMLVPLVGVVLTLSMGRWPGLQRAASVVVAVTYGVVVGGAVWGVVLAPGAPGAAAYQVGGWAAPFGITLVLDGLSAFMLVVAAAVAVSAIPFSVEFVDVGTQQVYYHPLFHALVLGATGAFLTGDLFNLFVWFEVMLVASYVFVAFYGGGRHTAASFRYLVLNVAGSGLMLLGIGGLYAVTGTLNMADMSRRLADPGAYGVDVAPVVGLSALLLAVFALKAGLVPFQFWVPAAYTAAPLPVTAMFAGVTKKVGMYAIVRLYFTVFAGAPVTVSLPGVAGGSPLALLAPALAAMGVASVLVGGLGAVSRDSLEATFAYSSVGQVGFIAIPVAVAAASTGAAQRLALVAALVYALHHSLAKALLFLSTATVAGATGTNRISALGGLGRRAPALAGAFFVGILSLVGVPPLVGFFGKFLVFDVAVRRVASAGGAWALVALVALLLGALLTIAYTTRTWTRSFWGAETPAVSGAVVDGRQVAILVALAGAVIVVGVGFEPVYRFAEAAAAAAVESGAYVDVVDPAGDEVGPAVDALGPAEDGTVPAGDASDPSGGASG